MRNLRLPSDDESSGPRLEKLDWKTLYRKSKYEVRTRDGWTLVVTRYQPVPQRFAQPVFGEPLLLVHGFSQNRHAWSCGGFIKHMLLYGADLHLLELRGHGLSSVDLQRAKAAGRAPLPEDLQYGWDIDTYFLEDVPAAIEAVKTVTGHRSIFYCGHSLGGMLGYGYASSRDDIAGLVAIGAPGDPGKGYLPLRLLAHLGPAFERAVDAAMLASWATAWLAWQVRDPLRRSLRPPAPERSTFEYYPIDRVLRLLERALAHPDAFRRWAQLARHHALFVNPAQIGADEVRWLLREGGEREPRRVVAQLARWMRHGELRCYRNGYDFRANFRNIRIPMAIIFGDLDPLASLESTRQVYKEARSEYLLWRPVKGNSHVELTVGRDVRQISFDVKNLLEYARKFPRRREGEGQRAVRAGEPEAPRPL